MSFFFKQNARVIGLLCLVGALGALSYSPLKRHVLAVRLLQRMASEDLSRPTNPGVSVSDLYMPDGTPIAANVYEPGKGKPRFSVILAHGIHHQGIAEPRLIRFATHLASLGCRVITPELKDLANYHITEEGVKVLQQSVTYATRTDSPVGLIGFSFAGGLSLLAAQEPSVGKKLRYVASIGGYHDLHRSLRFLATHEVDTPAGKEASRAHEYGLLVLVYGNLRELSLGEDENTFRSTLLAWLKEDRPLAYKEAKRLTTDRGKEMFDLLEKQQFAQLAPKILSLLDANRDQLKRLSPRGQLGTLKTEVILLHGADDRVVPPEETLFASAELKSSDHPNHRALVTPLLEHVRVEKSPGYSDEIALIRLMARLL